MAINVLSRHRTWRSEATTHKHAQFRWPCIISRDRACMQRPTVEHDALATAANPSHWALHGIRVRILCLPHPPVWAGCNRICCTNPPLFAQCSSSSESEFESRSSVSFGSASLLRRLPARQQQTTSRIGLKLRIPAQGSPARFPRIRSF